MVAWLPCGAGIDGLCVGDGGRGVSVVNTDMWGARQRFNLKHEIAHWVFGDVDDGERTDRDVLAGGSDAKERAAGSFAASFLVPDQAVRRMAASLHPLLAAAWRPRLMPIGTTMLYH